MKPKTKSEETRERIRTAAIDLFRDRGFDQTTMREIAAAAGVATGAAYYYFDSKDAIVLAFYEHAARELEPLVEDALHASKTLEGRMRAILEVKLNYFAPNRALMGALAAQMPRILWIYTMGVLLFWIYDHSKNQARTHALVDKSLGLVTAMLKLSNVPLLRPARKTVQEIVAIIEG